LRLTYQPKHGVMTHQDHDLFHTSTHVNAPIHLLQAGGGGDLALDRFFGHRCRLSIPKGQMGQVERLISKGEPEILRTTS